jgi:hypothetical protein
MVDELERRGKYAFTTIEAVFSVVSMLRLYKKNELEPEVTVTGSE